MLNVKDNVASAMARRARRSRVILHDPPISILVSSEIIQVVPERVVSSVGRAGVITVAKSRKGSLAQLVEQLTFNQLVAGSNPARPTNVKRRPKGAFLLCAELNDSNLPQVRVERSETTEPLAATARRARRSRVILHDPPISILVSSEIIQVVPERVVSSVGRAVDF